MKGKRFIAILMSVMLTASSMTGAVYAAETTSPSEAGIEQLSEGASSLTGEESAEQESSTEVPAQEGASIEAPTQEGFAKEAPTQEEESAEEALEEEHAAEEPAEQTQENSAEDTEAAQNEAKESPAQDTAPTSNTGSAQDTAPASNTGSAQETEPETVEDKSEESTNTTALMSGVFDGDSPEDFYENSIPVYIGKNTVEVSVTEGELFRFEPEYYGTYTFFTVGEYDTIGSIFGEIDGEMYALTADDNSGEDDNFSASYEMEEYEAYYLGVMFADYETASGTREITLRIMTEDCGDHWPQDGTEVVTEPTCMEKGYTTYICEDCGQEYRGNFTDESHNYDEDGICRTCGEEAPCTVQSAEIGEDEDGVNYVEFTYTAEYDGECVAYVEIQEEGSEDDPYVVGDYINVDYEGVASLYLEGYLLPEYYIIRVYFKDADNDRRISNVYVNDLHTKEMYDLLHSTAEDYDQNRTIEFSENSFGVFSDNTVIIYGTSSVNTILDYSGYTYILTNADAQAGKLQDGCEIAYFYDNELQIVAHVKTVTRPQSGTVVIETEDPELDVVFEYLKLDEDIDHTECTLDLSNLPEGVTYMGEGELFEEAEAKTQSGAYFAVTETDADEEGAENDTDSVGQSSSRPAAGEFIPELQETTTTLAYTQNYNLDSHKIGAAELNGSVSMGISIPLKLYISHSRWSLDYTVKSTMTGTVSISGKLADGKITLGALFIPIASGVFSIHMDPELFITAGGEISLSTSFSGKIVATAGTGKKPRVLSSDAGFKLADLSVQCSVFMGIDLVPMLFFVKKCKVVEMHCKIGPKITASTTTPIPEDQQVEGDHMCQLCIDGDGHIVIQISGKFMAFGSALSASHTFKLKGFDFYYSLDYGDWGRGNCPHIKGDDNPGGGGSSGGELPIGSYYYLDSQGNYYICSENPDETLTIKGFDACIPQDYYTIPENILLCVEDEDDPYTLVPVGSKRVTEVDVNSRLIGYFCCGEGLINVTVPSGIKRIKSMSGFISMETLTLPSGIQLEEYAFEYCSSLAAVTLPDTITEIPDGLFSGCGLESFELPSSIKTIGDRAFAGSKLKTIVLPEGLKSIGDGAFEECQSLENIFLPEGLTKIGAEAFKSCYSLTEISIPDSVVEAGEDVFEDNKLKKITIGKNVPIDKLGLGNKTWYSQYTESEEEAPPKDTLKEVILVDGRTIIEGGAFSGCSALTEIAIPDSVEIIEGNAFADCEGFTEFVIPDGVTEVWGNVFEGCSNLKKLIIGKNVDISIDGWGNNYGHKSLQETLTSVEFTDGRTTINNRAFEGCTALEEVKFPSTLKGIDWHCFYGCINLKELTLPDSLERIVYGAFEDCSGLLSLYIPDNVTVIGNGAFDGCTSLKTVVVAGSVVYTNGNPVFFYQNFDKTECPDVTVYVPQGEQRWCEAGRFLYGAPEGYYDMNPFGDAVMNVVEYQKIDRIGRHTYLFDKKIKEPTEEEEGKEQYKCVLCGEVITETIPKLEVLDLSDAVITGISDEKYTGKAITQTPVVSLGSKTLTSGTDYTVSYSNNTNVGTATAKFTGKGKYTGTKTVTFRIQPVDISQAAVSGIKSMVYTGNAITQTPIVTMGVSTLISGTDYTVSYSNNTDAGTATLKITGKGNYTGTVTGTFKILPGKTTRGDMFNLANNVKVTWKAVPGAKYYKVYRSGIKDPVIVTSALVGYDKTAGLVNGQKYTYKIVASLTGKGDASGDSPLSYSKVMYRLKTVAIRSAKNTAPGKVTVTYDKTTAGDSYVLQYSEKQDMSGAKTKVVMGANTTSYVIGGLKKGKTYYISIRVRKKVNGIDYYTTFGVAKKVKITK